MELDKKELTEFAELVRSNADKKIESIVKGYMDYNSVNSEAQNETPNVNNNEQKENNCHNHKCVWNVFTSNRCGAKDVKLCPYRQL